MRFLAIGAFTLLLMVSAQSQHKTHETNLPAKMAAITEHLRKAKLAKSPSTRKCEILQAQKLIVKLPPSPINKELKTRLNKALGVGLETEDANALLEEAIEIAESANKLLQQKPKAFEPEEAKATLVRVLSSPEFRDPLWLVILRRLEKPLERLFNWLGVVFVGVFGWLAKILKPVFEWISAIIGAIGAWLWYWFQLLMKISPILAWTIVGVFGSIVLASLAYKILKWWKQRQKAFSEVTFAEALVIPEQLLKEAEIAAKNGDYLTALRKAYKALLLVLDQIGLIRFREQWTNWEYLAEIQRKAPPDFALHFREITFTFDLCFYARKFATASEYKIVRQFAEESMRRAIAIASQ